MDEKTMKSIACAGGTVNEGMCGGDVGGPLVIESKTGGDSEDVLVGAGIGSGGCGKWYPGGFARVSYAPYHQW